MLGKKIPIPFKDMVLCEKRIWEENASKEGFLVKEKHVDEYIIVDLGEKFDKEKYPFEIGDHVLVSSTGSEFILKEKKYWLLIA
jgi:co-chaperonin GroES (HSP10)